MKSTQSDENQKKLLSDIDIPKELEKLIPVFLERRLEEAKTLAGYLAEKKFDSIEDCGHRMKGHGEGYGFPRISENGRRLEDFAKNENVEGLKVAIGEYSEYISLLTKNQKSFLSN